MHITQIVNATTMSLLVGRLMNQLRGDMTQLKGLSTNHAVKSNDRLWPATV